MISPDLASKPVVSSWLSLKTKVMEDFPVWALKPAALICLFESQNHGDTFLLWVSKPSGL
jgi:hypothetical protein